MKGSSRVKIGQVRQDDTDTGVGVLLRITQFLREYLIQKSASLLSINYSEQNDK